MHNFNRAVLITLFALTSNYRFHLFGNITFSSIDHTGDIKYLLVDAVRPAGRIASAGIRDGRRACDHESTGDAVTICIGGVFRYRLHGETAGHRNVPGIC